MDGYVFRWPERDLPSDVYVGVVLERLTETSTHTGFLYRSESSNGTYVLHLWGHRRLRHDPPKAGQLCVLCKVEPVRVPAIAALARRLWRKNKNQGIPYAFSSPDQEWFSIGGEVLLGRGKLGLTCSNFVLAFYRAAGLPLVQLDTWPNRAEDTEWQTAAIAKLSTEWTELGDHVKQVELEIGIVRCRPIEVAGAAAANELPCDFETAVALGSKLESWF
jgi:hypothetical protein